MKRSVAMHRLLFRFRYPKLLLFLLSVIIAWLIFSSSPLGAVHDFVATLGYAGLFIAGFFYVYGLTSVPATATILILAKDHNPLLAIAAAAFGALLADIVLFLFMRYEFKDEMDRLPTRKFLGSKNKSLLHRIEKCLYMAVAALIIASPLPTEIGITMMASIKEISARKFMVIAYVLHTAAIAVIIIAAEMI